MNFEVGKKYRDKTFNDLWECLYVSPESKKNRLVVGRLDDGRVRSIYEDFWSLYEEGDEIHETHMIYFYSKKSEFIFSVCKSAEKGYNSNPDYVKIKEVIIKYNATKDETTIETLY